MRLTWGILLLALLWAFRLARVAVALVGLASWLGDVWALLIVALAAAARLHWLLRVAAFLTLWLLWHWPWWVALPLAVPRGVLVLPGLINTALARLRHPRPRWPAPPGAHVAQAAQVAQVAQVPPPPPGAELRPGAAGK